MIQMPAFSPQVAVRLQTDRAALRSVLVERAEVFEVELG
jgi:hypothetical protein